MAKTNELSCKRHNNLPKANPLVVDRISSFPDSVLHNILSFIPTKQAVATSILGKRWRFLWTEVPNIDLDSKDYKANKTSFQDAVYQVLLLHKVRSINKFRLWDENFVCGNDQIDLWVRTAVSRDVRMLCLSRLDVNISRKSVPYKFPQHALSCITLVELELWGLGISISSSSRFCLPNLKKLQLLYVEYENDESLHSLISGCPVLEDLTIHRYSFNNNLHCCDISSPTIVCLTLYFMLEAHPAHLNLDTPKLKHLRLSAYGGTHSWYASAEPMLALIEADISLNMDILLDSRSNFLEMLYNLRCLKLSVSTSVHGKHRGERPQSFTLSESFKNLIELHFSCENWLLFKLLEIADNLQILVINQVAGFSMSGINHQNVPKCLLSCLITIKIHDFKDEYEMVRYYLMNSKVLKRMEIEYGRLHRRSNKKSDAFITISQYPRGSNTCEIVFR